ncbi:MAG: hypothetical protein IJ019_03510 [Alphaproteobacteria bacterium]|nr:hypothetical protein [Alphaproteobacteria bacterium]
MDKLKLPLMVLYDTGESWYIQENAKPIAIFIESDKEAVYVKNLEKTDYITAREMCDEMDVANLFWSIPKDKQMQKLLNVVEDFNKTAEMIGVEPLKNAKYWTAKKIFNGVRLGVNFGLEKGVAISECEYAYTRPFLRLSNYGC